jgi:hypothetical protein
MLLKVFAASTRPVFGADAGFAHLEHIHKFKSGAVAFCP